jgi:hypothetical protein
VSHSLTPDQTALRARVAAHSMHAQGKTNTAPATKAFLDRFEREVDPESVLPPEERAKRAEHARKAYFSKLAFKSARARAARKHKRDAEQPLTREAS